MTGTGRTGSLSTRVVLAPPLMNTVISPGRDPRGGLVTQRVGRVGGGGSARRDPDGVAAVVGRG
ncbi:hypothetical protein AB0N06_23660, partial [Streptomyces sp. NPDC051020]|uniref:hypothetical protein n=1 Tax=Streptomyces sp. NPDC051020 TaxID=3155409 RepID=UPI00344348FF